MLALRPLLVGFGFYVASASAQSLLAVLQNSGHTEFARLLQEQEAVINAVPGSRLIVYAPPNAAISKNGGAILARESLLTDNQTKSGLFNYAEDTAPELRRRWLAGPGDTGTGACPVWALETLLSHPSLVNLGPGRNQTIVQKDVGSASLGVVFSGLGAGVKVTSSDIPFGGGVVRPIAGTLTLPRNLSATLPFLNVGKFEAALQRTGLLADLDSRTRITVLIPTDAAFRNTSNLPEARLIQALKGHVLVDVAAYTPLLRDGASFRTLGGTNVTVSVQGETVFLGGSRISSGDAIITNGVVHTIDRVLAGSVITPIVTGAAVAFRPILTYLYALPAVVAVLAVYYAL
ncbi:FAS1 domain-containing protein [Lasiosphaeris hirsuta]|uniref:FAS1 domain-containing protein n=1 Tax=Lasiosphaeris hirsuta TaxID=260670 RepID=A0AA40ANX1_9PEZI|nr:FAS1 domain-containing protein [Lasiosphaeris hirsuta]